jgi:hypothetical protein
LGLQPPYGTFFTQGDCLEILNVGRTVLDSCAGSFTTGVTCINTNWKFIGIEKDKTRPSHIQSSSYGKITLLINNMIKKCPGKLIPS